MTSEQLTIHDVPHARRDDPRTSVLSGLQTEAEEGTTSTLKPGSTKHVALYYISLAPRTAIEVERTSGRRGIWKRVSDLKNADLIESVGTRRDPETKREGIVWQVTERGYAVLSLLDQRTTVVLTADTFATIPETSNGSVSESGHASD